jgi:hypothetical protein
MFSDFTTVLCKAEETIEVYVKLTSLGYWTERIMFLRPRAASNVVDNLQSQK